MTQGYYYRKDRPNTPYRVVLSINGKMTYIDSFQTPEEAHAAYEKTREEYPCQPKNGGRKKGSKYVYKKKEKKPKRSRTNTHWTEEQKNTLVRLFETTDLSYSGIGEALGRTEKAVYGMLRRIRLNQVSK